VQERFTDRWELDKKDQSVVVAVNGPLITNDIGLLTRAALDGVGLAFMSEDQAAPHLANGALVRVLEDWCRRCASEPRDPRTA
jgi:DNA-binding transcriptional LysR family regulator